MQVRTRVELRSALMKASSLSHHLASAARSDRGHSFILPKDDGDQGRSRAERRLLPEVGNQHQSADSITIERKKTKSCECAPLRRLHNLRDDRFIDGDIVGSLLSGHASDNVAELLNSPVELTLEGVRGYWDFSDRRQRTKRNGGRGLGLQAKYDCPKVFTEPLG